MQRRAPIRSAALAASIGPLVALAVLFLGGRYDFVNDPVGSPITGPMAAACTDLTQHILPTGHWMQNERPADVSAAIVRCIAQRVPAAWPRGAVA